MKRGAWVAWVAWALACTPSAADHEDLGDRAYAAGAYADALAEYELALRADPGNAGLHAKTAAAALHTEDYALAAAEYVALAREDRSRAAEAAEGLERVIRAALEANDRTAVALALSGLRELAPERPLGRFARLAALDAAEAGRSAEALALLPTAAAAAPDARSADSLLFVYAMTALRARDCATALAVFEGLLRRNRAPEVVDGAREGQGLCALVEGQLALERGQPAAAEGWFRQAAAPGSSPEVMRGAFLGLGDVLLAQGDLAGALGSYQQALSGGAPGDTIAQRAREKLNALGRAEPPPPER
ncbi:MAG TPA: tetratricopeptide repeat protein [Gemmatimonadales bacterium]|nr:tetratricopeptide repeat protein [Gemmatimonadales bacterium]